jgi:UDP-N-acetylmuramyl pentapeptide phosphotransferase/UDP-N-acetylglucosamine-1-phosphate transferase
MVTIIFIINAFNIIDGINLLAGSVGVLIFTAFGAWFYVNGYHDYAVISAAMIGAILAFLRYNYTPAQIFMGDSGSLSIGLLASVLAIEFVEKNEFVLNWNMARGVSITATPAMAVAILIIPIYDTLRAFTLRLLRRRSPFHADRIHIHHRLLDLGFSHVSVTMILLAVNMGFIVLAFVLQPLGNLYLLLVLLIVALALSVLLYLLNGSRRHSTDRSGGNVGLPVNFPTNSAAHQ